MEINDFEFECKELQDFMRGVHKTSEEMINRIIKENSPIQIGETVDTINYWESNRH